MELKFRSLAMVLFVLASAPAFAQDNVNPSAPAPGLAQADSNPVQSVPDPLSSASYTIPDTDIDLRMVTPPQSAPGTRMVLAPDIDDGAFGATLQIPLAVLEDN